MDAYLYKNIIYIKNNILYFKDEQLYKFEINNYLDEYTLTNAVKDFKLDLIKYNIIKKTLNSINNFKIETIKDAIGRIIIQDIKIFYNCKDDGITFRDISFTFYKNKFILGV